MNNDMKNIFKNVNCSGKFKLEKVLKRYCAWWLSDRLTIPPTGKKTFDVF